MVVYESVELGNLQHVLKITKNNFELVGVPETEFSGLDEFCVSDLHSFAFQIANGMEYLTHIPVRRWRRACGRKLLLINIF